MMPKADYTEILKSELLTAEEPDQSTQFQAAFGAKSNFGTPSSNARCNALLFLPIVPFGTKCTRS